MGSFYRTIVILSFISLYVTSALVWLSSSFPNGTHVNQCAGSNVTLPWVFNVSTSESVLFAEWFKTQGQEIIPLASYNFNRFLQVPGNGRSVTFLPNAGLLITNSTPTDSGLYTVHANVRGTVETFIQTAIVGVSEAPVVSNGVLDAFILQDNFFHELTGEWHTQVGCGKFHSLGHPPVSVVWTTPSDQAVTSTYYKDGTFFLALPNPVEEGDYSCSLDKTSPAVSCLQSKDDSLKNPATVRVLGVSSKMSLLVDALEALMGQVVSLTKVVQNLTTSFFDLQEQHENLTDTVERLQEENENLTGAVKRLEERDENSKALEESLQRETENLRLDVDGQIRLLPVVAKDAVKQPASCAHVRKYMNVSGVHTLYLSSSRTVAVYCDQTTDQGGWTMMHREGVGFSLKQTKTENIVKITKSNAASVIQRRQDGSEDFYRTWAEYERGFGNISENFWIGLEIVFHMTSTQNYTLRVDLTDFDNSTAYAVYNTFHVKGAIDGYRLSIGGFQGTAGDSLTYHHDMQFSTHDKDNDLSPTNCARERHGAWWYKYSAFSNLNGLYKPDGALGWDGVTWYYWKHDRRSYKRVEMKIRPQI